MNSPTATGWECHGAFCDGRAGCNASGTHTERSGSRTRTTYSPCAGRSSCGTRGRQVGSRRGQAGHVLARCFKEKQAARRQQCPESGSGSVCLCAFRDSQKSAWDAILPRVPRIHATVTPHRVPRVSITGSHHRLPSLQRGRWMLLPRLRL